MCPRSSDPFYLVTYYIKWVTTSWTYCIAEKSNMKKLPNIALKNKKRIDDVSLQTVKAKLRKKKLLKNKVL